MQGWKYLTLALLISSPAVVVSVGAAQTDSGSGAQAQQPAAAATQEQASDSAAHEHAIAEEGADEGPVEFTEEFLNDPAQLETGKMVWETCAGCHGAKSYPGKAPKLRPKQYTPEFVYDRVTNGYKKMPPWKDVFTQEERMAVTAYILHDQFAP